MWCARDRLPYRFLRGTDDAELALLTHAGLVLFETTKAKNRVTHAVEPDTSETCGILVYCLV